MKIILATVSTLLCIIVCSGAAINSNNGPKWNDLKVTWGPNFFKDFKSQPRTVADAKKKGFKLVDSGHCGATKSYNGIAYAKDKDYSLTLLYDVNGYIAGIQTGIPTSLAAEVHYPKKQIIPPFVLDGVNNTRYVLTAYFTDPSKICTTGRNATDFKRDGTGTNLWLQTGNFSNNVTLISKKEKDVKTPWVKGKCFFTMGMHYWFNISPKMSCDSFFPVFTLYNGGELNAFGWAMAANLPSSYDEHPGKDVFGLFMKQVPECLLKAGTISTLHIFLTSNILEDTC